MGCKKVQPIFHVLMLFAIIGEAFDEENIIRRKIRKRALRKGWPLLQDKKR